MGEPLANPIFKRAIDVSESEWYLAFNVYGREKRRSILSFGFGSSHIL
jgi:hypothetical protein